MCQIAYRNPVRRIGSTSSLRKPRAAVPQLATLSVDFDHAACVLTLPLRPAGAVHRLRLLCNSSVHAHASAEQEQWAEAIRCIVTRTVTPPGRAKRHTPLKRRVP